MAVGLVRLASPRAFSSSRRSDMGRLLVDDGADLLAREGAGELAALKAVDDLDPLDVPRGPPGLEELPVEDQLLGEVREQRAEGGLADEPGVGVLLLILF